MRLHVPLWLCAVALVGCGDDDDGGPADATGTTGTPDTTGVPTTSPETTGAPETTGVTTTGVTTTGPGETTGAATETGTTGVAETTGGAVADVRLESIVDGLVAPTALTVAPDDTMVVLDQPGIAYRIEQGSLVQFADLRDRVIELDDSFDERGLLGMAFHPDYPQDPRVFVYYSAPLRPGAPEGFDHTNVLSEFMVGGEGRIDPDSERELLAVDWPFFNHNAGSVTFGPDGMLIFGMGDGGDANDTGLGHPPLGNGQDRTTLQGSILRIDPDGGDPYGIPADNPFVGVPNAADEIWAYGLRNPYAFAFDPETDELFVGDAGQNLMEEVDLVQPGDNLGWNIREGTLCFDPDNADEPLDQCADVGPFGQPLVPPILTYTHAESVVSELSDIHGLVVVGGRVYRGTQLDDLVGGYVFGDWSRTFAAPEGQLLLGRREGDNWTLESLRVQGAPEDHIGYFIRGFGQDLDGEVYVLTTEEAGPVGTTGAVWRLARPG